MCAGHGYALTLIKAQGVIGLADAAAVTVDRPDILAPLKTIVKVRRQGQVRSHTVTPQHLRKYRAHRRAGGAKTDNVESEGLAVGQRPHAVRLLEPLRLEQRIALFGIKFERVVFYEQILDHVEIRQ